MSPSNGRMLGHSTAWGRCWCVMCRDSRKQKRRVRRALKRHERQQWKQGWR